MVDATICGMFVLVARCSATRPVSRAPCIAMSAAAAMLASATLARTSNSTSVNGSCTVLETSQFSNFLGQRALCAFTEVREQISLCNGSLRRENYRVSKAPFYQATHHNVGTRASTSQNVNSKFQQTLCCDRNFRHVMGKKRPGGSGRCQHGNWTFNCAECGTSRGPSPPKCTHGRRRCAICNLGKCEHGSFAHRCRKCGTGHCVHGKRRGKRCDECDRGPCPHNLPRMECTQCRIGLRTRARPTRPRTPEVGVGRESSTPSEPPTARCHEHGKPPSPPISESWTPMPWITSRPDSPTIEQRVAL